MKPRRPDSAKTQQTKRTLNSDNTKQDLNSSKFSETFSAGVNSFHQKPDQFKKYVSQKDKDPRFKHLVKPSRLQVIEQKSNNKEEQKPNYKPFQKKKDRVVQKSAKKIEQPQQKIQKPQEIMSLSRGFAEKNKQKMNSLKASIIQQKLEQQKVPQKPKPKINFGVFKVNKTGEKKEIKKDPQQDEVKKQTNITKQAEVPPANQSNLPKAKKRKTEEELRRQQEMKNLQRYVSEVQARNMEIFPSNYDRVISLTPNNTSQLEKIDLNNFLLEPTEEDYARMKYNIQELDQEIDNEKVQQSIDLQDIIDGDTETENESLRNQSYLSSLTSEQLKKRNAFLTQVLAGKISKKQINQLQEMNKSAMRIYKLEQQQKQQEDDQIYLTEINMVKKQSNRLIERNRLEAAGHLYRDCDYLSEEHQRRIEQLLNGQIGESPFECNQLQGLKRRGIDQGIRMYRQMNGSQEVGEILNQQTLPKDPLLKKQAQKKVLKEKMNSVNERLANIDKVVVTKAKIQSMIKKFEHTRRSSAYQELHQQNMRRFQQQYQHLEEAQRLLSSLGQKQNCEEVMREIQEQFNNLQKQIKIFDELDQQELRKMQKQRLRRKLRELEKVQDQNKDLEKQIQNMQRLKQEVQQKLRAYDQLQQVALPVLICEGYQPEETLQDIDEVITRKMNLMKKSGL